MLASLLGSVNKERVLIYLAARGRGYRGRSPVSLARRSIPYRKQWRTWKLPAYWSAARSAPHASMSSTPATRHEPNWRTC